MAVVLTSRIVGWLGADHTAAMNPSDTASSARRVLVLGATGRLGDAAVRAFHAAGWQVLAQARRAPATAWPAGVQALARAPTERDAIVQAARGAGVVVHGLNPLYTRWDAEAAPLLEAGLALARALGARFMLPGNVYGYGTSIPALVGPDTPMRPDTRKGRQRVEMEAAIARHAEASGLPASIVRAGDFFGHGTGSWIDLLIARSLRQRKLVYPGPRDLPHAWAYLPDLARAFVAVAEHDAPGCRAWLFGGQSPTGDELLDAIERAAARHGVAGPWRRAVLPWGLVRLAGWVHPMSREIARMSYLWRVPHTLDGRALDALPGVVHTPLDDALETSLRDLGLLADGPSMAR